MSSSLCVITTFFNPCGFKRPAENYSRFIAGMKDANVDVYIGRVSYDLDRDHVLPYVDPSNGMIWQKERLLNSLIPRVANDYEALAWVDADILFRNPHWVDDTLRQLDKFPVVQLFEECSELSPDGSRVRGRPSVASWIAQGQRVDFECCHPGYAWAARSEWLARHKLYDGHPTGGADAMMVKAFVGGTDYGLGFEGLMSPGWAAHWDAWYEPAARDCALGCVPGAIDHLRHGSVENRRYRERAAILQRHAFDPTADLVVAQNGTWRWSDAALCGKPELVRAVADLFPARKEDD